MLVKAFTAAAVFGVASAQAGNFIPVIVGMSPNGSAGNFFSPNRVTAAVGDTIQFQFMGGNHTVTQSTFDNPCIPINMVNASVVGFHSGFFPAMNVQQTGQVPAWNLQINDTRPIWMYCAQGRHCQSGMGMVINENPTANQTRTVENYQALAASAPQSMVPNGNIAGGGQIADPNNPNNPNGNINGQNPNGQQGGNGNAAAGLEIPSLVVLIAAGAALFL